MSFKLDIITPAGNVFDDQVDSLQVSGLMGGFEVYANHQATLAALKAGPLRIRKDGKDRIVNCESGILEVRPDHQVLVLVDGVKP